MKGQVQLMEYVLLTFFIILVIVMITLFLTGWQITTTGSEQRRVTYNKAEFLLRAVTNSPYINRGTYKEGSMLEDTRLSALTCSDLEILYGTDWFAEVESLEFKDPCSDENFPRCGYWSYCKKAEGTYGEVTIFEIPVNIYRKTTGEIDIGFLRVGLYGK